MVGAFILLSSALADPVDLRVEARAQQGLGHPRLVLDVNEPADALVVSLRCGAVRAGREGPAAAGETVVIELPVPLGAHACQGSLGLRLPDGSEGEMALSFEVHSLPPLKVEVPRERLDLDARRMEVLLDRPPGRVEVRAFGPGGVELGSGAVDAGAVGAGEPIEVTWQGEGEVIRLEVRGYDADGFWAAVELSPWAYNIPHEDVIFASGEAVIRVEEEPKLDAALAEVRAVSAKYGSVAELRLYVAGYTDTVGPAASNRELSQARARAIGAWFKARGFEGEVWVQGFGEEALAVPTVDEVDEPRNRRALYILAAEAPPPSTELPRAAWVRL